MKSIQDKQVLVTGGNRGIAFAIAQGLLTKDYKVIITSRSLDNVEQAAEKLQEKVIFIELDVIDDCSISKLSNLKIIISSCFTLSIKSACYIKSS